MVSYVWKKALSIARGRGFSFLPFTVERLARALSSGEICRALTVRLQNFIIHRGLEASRTRLAFLCEIERLEAELRSDQVFYVSHVISDKLRMPRSFYVESLDAVETVHIPTARDISRRTHLFTVSNAFCLLNQWTQVVCCHDSMNKERPHHSGAVTLAALPSLAFPSTVNKNGMSSETSTTVESTTSSTMPATTRSSAKPVRKANQWRPNMRKRGRSKESSKTPQATASRGVAKEEQEEKSLEEDEESNEDAEGEGEVEGEIDADADADADADQTEFDEFEEDGDGDVEMDDTQVVEQDNDVEGKADRDEEAGVSGDNAEQRHGRGRRPRRLASRTTFDDSTVELDSTIASSTTLRKKPARRTASIDEVPLEKSTKQVQCTIGELQPSLSSLLPLLQSSQVENESQKERDTVGTENVQLQKGDDVVDNNPVFYTHARTHNTSHALHPHVDLSAFSSKERLGQEHILGEAHGHLQVIGDSAIRSNTRTQAPLPHGGTDLEIEMKTSFQEVKPNVTTIDTSETRMRDEDTVTATSFSPRFTPSFTPPETYVHVHAHAHAHDAHSQSQFSFFSKTSCDNLPVVSTPGTLLTSHGETVGVDPCLLGFAKMEDVQVKAESDCSLSMSSMSSTVNDLAQELSQKDGFGELHQQRDFKMLKSEPANYLFVKNENEATNPGPISSSSSSSSVDFLFDSMSSVNTNLMESVDDTLCCDDVKLPNYYNSQEREQEERRGECEHEQEQEQEQQQQHRQQTMQSTEVMEQNQRNQTERTTFSNSSYVRSVGDETQPGHSSNNHGREESSFSPSLYSSVVGPLEMPLLSPHLTPFSGANHSPISTITADQSPQRDFSHPQALLQMPFSVPDQAALEQGFHQLDVQGNSPVESHSQSHSQVLVQSQITHVKSGLEQEKGQKQEQEQMQEQEQEQEHGNRLSSAINTSATHGSDLSAPFMSSAFDLTQQQPQGSLHTIPNTGFSTSFSYTQQGERAEGRGNGDAMYHEFTSSSSSLSLVDEHGHELGFDGSLKTPPYLAITGVNGGSMERTLNNAALGIASGISSANDISNATINPVQTQAPEISAPFISLSPSPLLSSAFDVGQMHFQSGHNIDSTSFQDSRLQNQQLTQQIQQIQQTQQQGFFHQPSHLDVACTHQVGTMAGFGTANGILGMNTDQNNGLDQSNESNFQTQTTHLGHENDLQSSINLHGVTTSLSDHDHNHNHGHKMEDERQNERDNSDNLITTAAEGPAPLALLLPTRRMVYYDKNNPLFPPDAWNGSSSMNEEPHLVIPFDAPNASYPRDVYGTRNTKALPLPPLLSAAEMTDGGAKNDSDGCSCGCQGECECSCDNCSLRPTTKAKGRGKSKTKARQGGAGSGSKAGRGGEEKGVKGKGDGWDGSGITSVLGTGEWTVSSVTASPPVMNPNAYVFSLDEETLNPSLQRAYEFMQSFPFEPLAGPPNPFDVWLVALAMELPQNAVLVVHPLDVDVTCRYGVKKPAPADTVSSIVDFMIKAEARDERGFCHPYHSWMMRKKTSSLNIAKKTWGERIKKSYSLRDVILMARPDVKLIPAQPVFSIATAAYVETISHRLLELVFFFLLWFFLFPASVFFIE